VSEPKAEAVPFTVFRVERDGHVTHTLARLGKPSSYSSPP